MPRSGKLIGSRGQSIVETALILPVIVLMLMGIIDFGLLFDNYLVIGNASREGARSAVIGSTDETVTTVVRNAASMLNQSRLAISISPGYSERRKGDEVIVTVEYDCVLLTPVIRAIVPNPLRLRAKTIMRVE